MTEQQLVNLISKISGMDKNEVLNNIQDFMDIIKALFLELEW